MTTTTFDPTAGERARAVLLHPEAPQPLLDPTDIRCGTPAGEPNDLERGGRRIVDPTDPACEGPAA